MERRGKTDDNVEKRTVIETPDEESQGGTLAPDEGTQKGSSQPIKTKFTFKDPKPENTNNG